MKITNFMPDVPDTAAPVAVIPSDHAVSMFTQAYEQAAGMLETAQHAERDFTNGSGTLLQMSTARAGADIALSTAAAVASRVGQIASTLGNLSL